MGIEKSFNKFIQFLLGFWNSEMSFKQQVNKMKFSLEGLFLAWFPANLFVRQSLVKVESLHDYTVKPYEAETPFHDVKDKMNGSIRMLCFWINVNLLFRSAIHFIIFLEMVLNFIKTHVEEPSNVQATSPNVSLAAENKEQTLPQEDLLVNLTAEQNEELPEPDSSNKVTKESRASSDVQDDQSEVAPSGCIAW